MFGSLMSVFQSAVGAHTAGECVASVCVAVGAGFGVEFPAGAVPCRAAPRGNLMRYRVE